MTEIAELTAEQFLSDPLTYLAKAGIDVSGFTFDPSIFETVVPAATEGESKTLN